jgi:hypothetical protein
VNGGPRICDEESEMNGGAATSTTARILGILALLIGIGTAMADESRAATISIQPNKLTRVYNRQEDLQYPWRVQSVSGAVSFSYELDIPVGRQITAMRYVHECPLPAPDPCGTSVGIWQVKASKPDPLRLLYSGSWSEYDMGRWVEASRFAGADITVRPGWRYFVGVTCSQALSMVGEIRVIWQ